MLRSDHTISANSTEKKTNTTHKWALDIPVCNFILWLYDDDDNIIIFKVGLQDAALFSLSI